jgi:hypothetical protein
VPALEAFTIVDLAPGADTSADDETNALTRCQQIVLQEQNFDAEYNGVYEAAAARREGLRKRAAQLVEDYRREIDAVAAALLKHGTLDQAAIDQVIG